MEEAEWLEIDPYERLIEDKKFVHSFVKHLPPDVANEVVGRVALTVSAIIGDGSQLPVWHLGKRLFERNRLSAKEIFQEEITSVFADMERGEEKD